MISLELNSVRAKDAERAFHESAIAEFLLSGGKVRTEDPSDEKPPEPRRAWIDPETVLKRKPMPITRAQRRILKQLAEAL